MTFTTLISASALSLGAALLAFPSQSIADNATATHMILAAATTPTDNTGAQKMPRKMGFRQRVHECKAEWKADKASGKVSGRESWKDYWKDCNIRLNTHQ
jgi:hypothetical protein